jgi:hypothetical protein
LSGPSTRLLEADWRLPSSRSRTFPEGHLTFQPSAFAMFAGYLLLAVLASIGQVPHEDSR